MVSGWTARLCRSSRSLTCRSSQQPPLPPPTTNIRDNPRSYSTCQTHQEPLLSQDRDPVPSREMGDQKDGWMDGWGPAAGMSQSCQLEQIGGPFSNQTTHSRAPHPPPAPDPPHHPSSPPPPPQKSHSPFPPRIHHPSSLFASVNEQHSMTLRDSLCSVSLVWRLRVGHRSSLSLRRLPPWVVCANHHHQRLNNPSILLIRKSKIARHTDQEC